MHRSPFSRRILDFSSYLVSLGKPECWFRRSTSRFKGGSRAAAEFVAGIARESIFASVSNDAFNARYGHLIPSFIYLMRKSHSM
jgi:hypothetical protein